MQYDSHIHTSCRSVLFDAESKELERFRSLFIYSSWIVLGLVAPIGMVGAPMHPMVVWAPFLLSVIFLGLPHGAVDHIVLVRLKGEAVTFRSLISAIIPYVAIAAAYLVIWFAAPIFAFGVFILMTWYHWGQGDMVALLQFGRHGHLRTRLQRAMTIVIRGAIPMVIPFIASPQEYIEAANLIIGSVSGSADSTIVIAPSTEIRLTIWSVVLMTLVVHYGAGLIRSRGEERDAWLEDLFESALLVVFFASVHPVFAAGLYFCVWHATRHFGRLVLSERDHSSGDSSLARHGRSVMAHALPTTLAAIALLGVLLVYVPFTLETVPQLVSVYLVLVSVLTLPHVWVVSRMDRADQVWRQVL